MYMRIHVGGLWTHIKDESIGVIMEYRLNKESLLSILAHWDTFFKRKVHFIACGGTAMTLLGVKESTRDVDLMVPIKSEYVYSIKIIMQLGYENKTAYGWAREGEGFIFDLFEGKKMHTTELLDNPLEEGKHEIVKEFLNIYLGVLNDYDLIVSKLFRGTSVDLDDCVLLAQAHKKEIDFKKLKAHFFDLLSYHPVGDVRIKGHWDSFERKLKETKK